MTTPLTTDDIEQLESLLFSERCSEEAMDYLEIHGLLFAVAISPKPITESRWLELIFDGPLPFNSNDEEQQFLGKLQQLSRYISQCLVLGENIQLPFEDIDNDDGEAARNWCVGFMEGVFLEEAAWFQQDEEYAAELLLPFMALSSLYAEDEFAQLTSDPAMMEDFRHQLPDLLIDLYLAFHTPQKK